MSREPVADPEPTVFVVDDEESVLRMIGRMLRSVALPVETFSSVPEFLERCDPRRPGCLVLDVRMPGPSGLDLQEILKKKGIEIPIIFITGHGDVSMSVRAMKAGAVDFIEKPFHDQVLIDAIRAALQRDAGIRRSAAARSDVLERWTSLTPREKEVLALVVKGRANKEIAAALGISERTIKLHRGNVMAKMRADSLADLVVLAQVAGVLPAGPPDPAGEIRH